MAKTKLKPWKKGLISEHLMGSEPAPASLVFLDNSPALTDDKHHDVVQVAYLAHPDNTLSIWMLYPSAEDAEPVEGQPAGVWKCEKKGIAPDRVSAHAHYDLFKWQMFRKGDAQRRKKAGDMPVDREGIRHVVRYLYDLQKLRIQFGNRDSEQAAPAVLDDDDKTFLGRQSVGLEALEKSALAELEHKLKKVPIYTTYLKDQKGVGPTLAGVIVAEIDIRDSETPSGLWAYAGLAVDNKTGKAVKRERGKKSNWNPFLKAKMIFVLGGCLLKSNSPWREYYDNYRNRKQNQLVKTCMLCGGMGALKGETATPCDPDEKGAKVCYNCQGKKHDVPWGRGDAHRHQAALRYMVKIFLRELWRTWRELEGLPIVDPYHEAKLGMRHGDHASAPLERGSSAPG